MPQLYQPNIDLTQPQYEKLSPSSYVRWSKYQNYGGIWVKYRAEKITVDPATGQMTSARFYDPVEKRLRNKAEEQTVITAREQYTPTGMRQWEYIRGQERPPTDVEKAPTPKAKHPLLEGVVVTTPEKKYEERIKEPRKPTKEFIPMPPTKPIGLEPISGLMEGVEVREPIPPTPKARPTDIFISPLREAMVGIEPTPKPITLEPVTKIMEDISPRIAKPKFVPSPATITLPSLKKPIPFPEDIMKRYYKEREMEVKPELARAKIALAVYGAALWRPIRHPLRTIKETLIFGKELIFRPRKTIAEFWAAAAIAPELVVPQLAAAATYAFVVPKAIKVLPLKKKFTIERATGKVVIAGLKEKKKLTFVMKTPVTTKVIKVRKPPIPVKEISVEAMIGKYHIGKRVGVLKVGKQEITIKLPKKPTKVKLDVKKFVPKLVEKYKEFKTKEMIIGEKGKFPTVTMKPTMIEKGKFVVVKKAKPLSVDLILGKGMIVKKPKSIVKPTLKIKALKAKEVGIIDLDKVVKAATEKFDWERVVVGKPGKVPKAKFIQIEAVPPVQRLVALQKVRAKVKKVVKPKIAKPILKVKPVEGITVLPPIGVPTFGVEYEVVSKPLKEVTPITPLISIREMVKPRVDIMLKPIVTPIIAVRERVKTRVDIMLKPKIEPIQKIKQIIKPRLFVKPIVMVKPIVVPKPVVIITPKISPVAIVSPMIKEIPITKPRIIYDIIPPLFPKIFPPPKFPPFRRYDLRLPKPKKRKKELLMFQYKYRPSLVALDKMIKGRLPMKKILTGIEIRPIKI